MNFYTEDELLALSGIQHYSFCPRQWALIHIEQQWQENVLTYEGRQLHRRADNPYLSETRGDVLITRAMPLVSHTLGIYGIADVVEFHAVAEGAEEPGCSVSLPRRQGRWRPYPVEYKRGKPKAEDWDEVQLCAQALALEEMLNVRIEEGALFYGERERRVTVAFVPSLRDRVDQLLDEMHRQFNRAETPPARFSSGCGNCSLVDLCVPRLRRASVDNYLQRYLADDEN